MCDVSYKLIAWIDGELTASEAADVEQHVPGCNECQNLLDAYNKTDVAFNAYCDAIVAAAPARPKVPRWAVALSGIAAAIAVVALLSLSSPRPLGQKFPTKSPVAEVAPAASAFPTIAPKELPPVTAKGKRRRQRHIAAPALAQNENWAPAEPAIEIVIPADTIYPPGAFPAGVNFVADVSIAADGSAQAIRLQPRLVGFERRSTQP